VLVDMMSLSFIILIRSGREFLRVVVDAHDAKQTVRSGGELYGEPFTFRQGRS
jgi:hypothetical protein